MIYHANFGKPILEKGSKLHGTIDKVEPFDDNAAKVIDNWADYGPPAKDVSGELVYCIYPRPDKDGKAHFVMENATGDKGIYFNYPNKQMPYFTQWKNPDSLVNGYVTGLEPATGFPHNRAWERKSGRVPKLAAGQTRKFQLEYTILSGKSDVDKAKKTIETLNGGKTPTLVKTPEADPRSDEDKKPYQ